MKNQKVFIDISRLFVFILFNGLLLLHFGFTSKVVARKVPSGSSPHFVASYGLSFKLQVVPNREIQVSPPPPPTPGTIITMLAPAPSPLSGAASSP
ncbi:Uncharacterized protein TCM_026213 [Theobroma cacao]|uniref:Uncharacterized protein n=1 Tax=Theobroma cacao TaxID=3641 RepID=A0A061F200_THECC|nr:Uncharacterized protein TCM_026213 [Theobroma cacao]